MTTFRDVLSGFVETNLCLYSFVFALPASARTVILVEGFFSVFWLHQCGFENVVALMGSSMSGQQREFLCSRFAGVRVLMDGDDAGNAAAATIAAELVGSMWVKAIPCPDGMQPDNLVPDELEELLKG